MLACTPAPLQIANFDNITIISQSFKAPEARALFDFKLPTVAAGAAASTHGGTHLNIPQRHHAASRGSAQQPVPKAQFYCNAMPWVDCSELRYHCTRFPDIDLCPQAYAEGRFPPGCSAKDFVRIDSRWGLARGYTVALLGAAV
jgi:hypothetical protein